jgi:hypothetical protein
MSGGDVGTIEGEHVGNWDLSGITDARLCRLEPLAGKVALEGAFSSDTIILAAACALLMSSVEDEPDGWPDDLRRRSRRALLSQRRGPLDFADIASSCVQ